MDEAEGVEPGKGGAVGYAFQEVEASDEGLEGGEVVEVVAELGDVVVGEGEGVEVGEGVDGVAELGELVVVEAEDFEVVEEVDLFGEGGDEVVGDVEFEEVGVGAQDGGFQGEEAFVLKLEG